MATIAKQYIKAVIEVEFDAGDEVSEATVVNYINDLIEQDQLSVDWVDAKGNYNALSDLTDEVEEY